MNNLLVNQGQWMGDMAIQHAGDIEAIFEMAQLNDTPVTAELEAGSYLLPMVVSNARMVGYFVSINKTPATRGDGLPVRSGGIGYMRIGSTFKVS